MDESDYEARVHYFFGMLFLVAREFGADECKLLFDASVPASVPASAKETPIDDPSPLPPVIASLQIRFHTVDPSASRKSRRIYSAL